MSYLALTTLFAFLAALAFSGSGMSALHVHLALAVGMLPLMFGAMLYFAPVLTRSGDAGRGMARLPWLALLGGATVVVAFAQPQWLEPGRNVAALLALGGAGLLLGWMTARSRAALGPAHPCLYWYQAALGCFVLALLSIAAMSVWPEQTVALKRLHLHLNLLGLIGLTAVGTLHVLLPTATGQPDPQVAAHLRSGLPWALSGTLLVALGAAWLTELAWLGALLWLTPLLRLLIAWARLQHSWIIAIHGVPPSLAMAGVGLTLVVLLGPLHGGGWISPQNAAHGFIAAFLAPLVTGALGQLLPLWLRPGVHQKWHEKVRAGLGKWSGLRALLFLCGGLMITLGWPAGGLLIGAGMALFLVQLPVVFTKN